MSEDTTKRAISRIAHEDNALPKGTQQEKWALMQTGSAVVRTIVWFPMTTYNGAMERLTRTPKLKPPKIDVEEMEAGTWPRFREACLWNCQEFCYRIEPTGYGWAALFRMIGYLTLRVMLPLLVIGGVIWGAGWLATLMSGLFAAILRMLFWLGLLFLALGIGYSLWKVQPVIWKRILEQKRKK